LTRLLDHAPDDQRVQEQLHAGLPEHLDQLVLHHLRIDGMHLRAIISAPGFCSGA